MSTSYYAVASAAIDAPMESGVAVFKGSDPYTPVAEANFYMATVQEARVELELAALGFMRVDDWHVSGYLTATVERLATRHECASRYDRTAVHDQGTGRPRRKRTACCGAQYEVTTGMFGLFLHSSVTGSADYRRDDALSLHRTEHAAEKAARDCAYRPDQLAVRWVVMGGTL